ADAGPAHRSGVVRPAPAPALALGEREPSRLLAPPGRGLDAVRRGRGSVRPRPGDLLRRRPFRLGVADVRADHRCDRRDRPREALRHPYPQRAARPAVGPRLPGAGVDDGCRSPGGGRSRGRLVTPGRARRLLDPRRGDLAALLACRLLGAADLGPVERRRAEPEPVGPDSGMTTAPPVICITLSGSSI